LIAGVGMTHEGNNAEQMSQKLVGGANSAPLRPSRSDMSPASLLLLDSLKFLSFYALYMAGEKQKRDHVDVPDNTEIQYIVNILEEERREFVTERRTAGAQRQSVGGDSGSFGGSHHPNHSFELLSDDLMALSGPLWYLLGVCYNKLHKKDQALDCFIRSVRRDALLWCSWLCIAEMSDTKENFAQVLQKLEKKAELRTEIGEIMFLFFKQHVHLELQMNEEAQEELDLLVQLFPTSSYVQAQRAFVVYNLTELDEAQKGLEQVFNHDPYRLDHLDTYSNILYVKNNKAKLSHLAHHAHKTDKYRAETCCVVGNYYSLKGFHEKAVIYFKRALRVNPTYLSAWTLMGHEYVEMKNTTAAVHAYRTAIDVNNRDYRAWYGLGQTYEILRMQQYALYYYSKATALRQYDGRMWCALATCYEQLERYKDALRCFERAHLNHDPEGIALCKMANLYRRLNENRFAAKCFIKLLEQLGVLKDVEQFSRDNLPSVTGGVGTNRMPLLRAGFSNSVYHLFSTTQEEFDTLEQDESMQGITSTALLFLSIYYLQEKSDIENSQKFARYLHYQANITDQIKKVTENVLKILQDAMTV